MRQCQEPIQNVPERAFNTPDLATIAITAEGLGVIHIKDGHRVVPATWPHPESGQQPHVISDALPMKPPLPTIPQQQYPGQLRILLHEPHIVR